MAYATTDELAYGVPAQALVDVPLAQQQFYLDNQAAFIDSHLRSRYTLPLSQPYPNELRSANVALAVCDVLAFIGLNPDQYDNLYGERCEMWREWLKAIADGTANLDDDADATPGTSAGGPTVDALPSRDWDTMLTGDEDRV